MRSFFFFLLHQFAEGWNRPITVGDVIVVTTTAALIYRYCGV